jgi:hypothetical protein
MGGAIVKVVACGILILGDLTISGQAAKRSTNPILAKQLESQRHHESALPNSATTRTSSPFGQTPFDGNRLSKQQQLPDDTASPSKTRVLPRVMPRTDGNDYRSPSFVAAPSADAIASNDTSNANAAAVANFDGKNGPEIVTVQADGTLNLIVNDGKGNLSLSYSNSSAVALNPTVMYMEEADLNNDGYPDIVAADQGNSAFLVFMNRGDGTFADAVSVPVSPASGASFVNGGTLAIADINGDGIPDVVVVSNLQIWNPTKTSATTVFSQQIFLGKGDGTFVTPATSTDTTLSGYLYIEPGQGLIVKDVNHDELPDIVAEVANGGNNTVSLATSLAQSRGLYGQFSSASASARAALPIGSALELTDLNGDGNPDAAYITGDGNVYVSLGNGNGTFQTPLAVVSNVPRGQLIRLADFNGDGYPDLLVYSYGLAAVYAGRGDGTFDSSTAAQYGGNQSVYEQPVTADFDGDGNLDFVWVDQFTGTVALYRGLGNGKFLAAQAVGPANAARASEYLGYVQVIAAGDFNGDGKTDVLAYDWTNTHANKYGLYPELDVGLSNGSGGFNFVTAEKGSDLAGVNSLLSVLPIVADFNNDGFPDLLFLTLNGLSIAFGKGDGTFGPIQVATSFPVPVSDCWGLADYGDINNDGNLDLVMAYKGASPSCVNTATASGFFVLLGHGDGTFTASYTAYGSFLYEPKLIDLNNDGKLDLVFDDSWDMGGMLGCMSCATPITVLPGRGDGTFDVANARAVLSSYRIADIIPGDYDSDGKQDLTLHSYAQIDPNNGAIPDTDGVLLLRGNGDFTFADPVLLAAGTFPGRVRYADFNQDGRPDLVFSVFPLPPTITYPGSLGLVILPNLGGGSFGSALNLAAPNDSLWHGDYEVVIGDFNGDGSPDFLVAPFLNFEATFDPISVYSATGNLFNPSVVYLNQAGNTLALSASSSSAYQGSPVVLDANLSTVQGAVPATGTVAFYSNGALIGTMALSDGLTAQLPVSTLPVGTNKITAVYSGDLNHNPATASAVSVVVQALVPSFSLASSQQTMSIADGQKGTLSLALTANGTFNGRATFACSGLPTEASCAFSPAAVTLSGGQTGTVDVSVYTRAPSLASGGLRGTTSNNFPGSLALTSAVFAMTLVRSRKKWTSRRVLGFTAVGLLCIVPLCVTTGCGSDRQTSTPSGTYVVTISATGVSSGTTVTKTTVVAITVTR